MVTLEWDLERTDGVTLVHVYVTAARRRHVRVENRLDGPVWPPRRRGRPAAGWDDDGFEGVVTPDERLVAGYATPAPPADPPVELVADEPVSDDAAAGVLGAEGDSDEGVPAVEATASGVVRALGDALVPRDAVPVSRGGDATSPPATADATDSRPERTETGVDPGADERTRATEEPGTAGRGDSTAPDWTTHPNSARDATSDRSPDGPVDRAPDSPPDQKPGTGRTTTVAPVSATSETATPAVADVELVVPGAVRAWLADVERRVAAAECRNGADDGSPLQTAVAGDLQALDRVADRAGSLADRADGLGDTGRSESGRDRSGRKQSGREQSGQGRSGRNQSGREQSGRNQSDREQSGQFGRGRSAQDRSNRGQSGREWDPAGGER